jgi:Ser/Thr protein kinase RdoA (MazF antagonist)
VKIGATPITAEWFRTEARIYAELRGWYLPRVLGFDDDGERPALALEDLSGAAWPPPWTDDRVGLVREALDAIHGTAAPSGLDQMVNDPDQHWAAIAVDPGPLLALGLCSAGWLDRSLPALTDAATRAPLAGDALVHLDVRSDNLCFRAGRAVVIDWSHARLANPDLDVAFWLPSLESEGGPRPESILPNAPELAAWVAGFFCRWAGLPDLPDAPHVRPLQRSQAATALPWAARALGLPPPA